MFVFDFSTPAGTMGILFTITGCIWFLSEIVFNRLFRAKASDKQNADNGSLVLIWTSILLCLPLSVFFAREFSFPIRQNHFLPYFGIALIYIGLILRILIIRSLGPFFTVKVTIRQNHALKKDGFYRYLRHPSYFASLLSFIGFGIALNNWISLAMIVTVIVIVFIKRIAIEEKVLVEEFGADYLEYKRHTWTLIPFIH